MGHTGGLTSPRPGADNTEPVFQYRWVSQASKEGGVSKKESLSTSRSKNTFMGAAELGNTSSRMITEMT